MRIGFGWIKVRITSGDVEGFLQDAIKRGALLYDVVREDHLSVVITIQKNQFNILEGMCQKRGDKCKIVGIWGLCPVISEVLRHRVLLFCILILLLQTIIIPRYTLFFEITGNEKVTDSQIITALSQCGLKFGSSRRAVRSEQLKTQIIEKIPGLEWIGITTEGCVVKIQVQEKLEEIKNDHITGISSIVAAVDGSIDSVTVTKGVVHCKRGQTVKKGQLLISGYEDCGILIRGVAAEGEIFAKTYRTESIISPSFSAVRTNSVKSQRNYSIMIGKKLINFNNSSGISPMECAKIEKTRYLTLPGGFQLPIAIISEDIIYYDLDLNTKNITNYDWLKNTLMQYVENRMISGSIEQKEFSMNVLGDHCVLYGYFYCTEEIGRRKIEEHLNYNG